MKAKSHVKRGDIVVVRSGSHRGKQGKVLEILVGKGRALVEGVGMIKKHERKSQDNPNGRIVEREGSIALPNLMLLSEHERRAAKHAPAKA
jgi:large subunit ribosomal protein L24